MISAITCTGDRQVAFDLARKWMNNQVIKPDQWLIVDDGKVPMNMKNLEEYACYVRREPKSNDPKYTLTVNIQYIFPLVKGDKIIFWEDDEYYASKYILEMANRLDSYDVVGIGDAKYYHLPTGGYVTCANMQHASLAETAFKASFISNFKDCLDKGMEIRWLDDRLWEKVRNSKMNGNPIPYQIFVDREESLYVGIKGLPGRFGIGNGHYENTYKNFDKDRLVLRKWIPKDFSIYEELMDTIKIEPQRIQESPKVKPAPILRSRAILPTRKIGHGRR